jgi:hypothetical protein
MAMSMWEILAFIVWTFFVAYTTWYLTKAKYNAPISVDEARLLWRIHRRNVHCNARKWREIKHSNKIVGFECECGYRHVQKRPVVGRPPTVQIEAGVHVANPLGIPPYSTRFSRE